MKIIAIEPTPSPNTMKLNLNESLPGNLRITYNKDQAGKAPEFIARLLTIDGVTSIFHAADFIAIDRHPKFDWRIILTEVREVFEETAGDGEPWQMIASQDAYGEAKVSLQLYRGIPIQIRAALGGEERRIALSDRFQQSVMKATSDNPHLLKERRLDELGVRYGELDEILEQVQLEIEAAYDDSRLETLVKHAIEAGSEPPTDLDKYIRLNLEEIAAQLKHPDWQKRYAALEQMDASLETLPLIVTALQDDNVSIRRLATVYLGDLNDSEALPYLFQALKDRSAIVRRTAGDTLSDLGDPAAIEPMILALQDRNKLVRWRAARFLFEVGDDTALQALSEVQDDPEFEVSMQVKLALERIEGGHEAGGTVWQQITRRNQ